LTHVSTHEKDIHKHLYIHKIQELNRKIRLSITKVGFFALV